VHWTSGLADGIASSHMGKLVRVSNGGASTNEDFAGISFTLKQ